MPGFNRKGPAGEGPMTGRGRGQCAGTGARKSSQDPESQEKNQPGLWGLGRGHRRRRALGRGPRNSD